MQDVAALAGQVGPFVGAALGAYGARVLDKVEGDAVAAAADQVAGLGRRLLRLVVGRKTPAAEDVARAVERATTDPGNQDRVAVARVAVADALAGDPELVEQVRELLASPAGRGAIVALGERSVAAQSIVGSTINTGDIHPPR